MNSNHVALQSILYVRSELFSQNWHASGKPTTTACPSTGPVLHLLIEHAHTLHCQRSSYGDGYKQGECSPNVAKEYEEEGHCDSAHELRVVICGLDWAR